MGNDAAAFRERVVAAAYITGWRVVGHLPRRAASALFNAGADIVSEKGAGKGKGVEQLRRNLARVVGPANVTRKLVRASVRSYARYWREAFQLPAFAGDPALMAQLDRAMEGREHIDRAVAAGKGVILTLPHTGNWDMAGMWLVHRYGEFTTVAERLKPEVLFDAFVEYRESLGFDVLPLTGAAASPFPRLKEVLDEGGIVCLLGERDLGRHGIPVTFFGEETTFPVGPAKLAMETGAELIVAHSWFAGDTRNPGWGLKCDPPIEVTTLEETAQKIADGFEANIAAHPQDWHMLQPLWPADVAWHANQPRRKDRQGE